MPWPPMPVLISKSLEIDLSSETQRAAVSFSWLESSGLAWKCLYRSSYLLRSGRCLVAMSEMLDIVEVVIGGWI